MVRAVLGPEAQAFPKGEREKQSCGCWRSTGLEDWVLPLSLPSGLAGGGVENCERGLEPREGGNGGRGAGGVGPVETKGSERSELAGLASLSWVIRQRGRAKLAEQAAAVLQLFLSAPREGCVRAKCGPDGDRAGARGASRSRERRSRIAARGSRVEARGSRPAAERASRRRASGARRWRQVSAASGWSGTRSVSSHRDR